MYAVLSLHKHHASGEDKDGNYVDNVPIQATVDSVQIADDLQLLNGQIPEGWEDAVREDGKLKENTNLLHPGRRRSRFAG